MEDLARNEEQSGVRQMLIGLRDEVRDFRAEYREGSRRLEALIRSGNKELMGALTQVQEQLVAAGVDPEHAVEMTAGQPKSFWERLNRWRGGSGPQDALEAALWAALDFVPGGIGVKLGIKIASAVRKSMKASFDKR